MTLPRLKETEVAEWADAWLHREGFETWYEVPVTTGRADIIATRGNMLWIVECKVAMSLDFILQLHDRLREKCNGVVGVIPGPSHSRYRTAKYLLEPRGIGLLTVSNGGYGSMSSWPALRRLDSSKLRGTLRDEYRRGTAGSQSNYWTPFKSLVSSLQESLQPGPLKDAAGLSCLGDYRQRAPAAQRRALTDYLRQGLIPGWGVENREGKLFVVKRSL